MAQRAVVYLEILVRRNMTRHGTFTTVRICAQKVVSDFVKCFFFLAHRIHFNKHDDASF